MVTLLVVSCAVQRCRKCTAASVEFILDAGAGPNNRYVFMRRMTFLHEPLRMLQAALVAWRFPGSRARDARSLQTSMKFQDRIAIACDCNGFALCEVEGDGIAKAMGGKSIALCGTTV
ncbi:hypothetical protein PWP93_24785 [Paraburkholderia sp. A1RI-2L]|uniref:hypothetical protein n=1 Tax=Paraburkholderia sp. A1RI-2L TaxID=3028367 RepID=UPI003B79E61D